jgi:hypothetical protein
MDEPLLVRLAECCRQTDGDAQKVGQIGRSSLVLLNELIQRFTAWILKNKERSSSVVSEHARLSCPCRTEFGCKREFVFEPPETLRRWLFSGDRYGEDRHLVVALSAAVESEVLHFAKRLQYVLGILYH